MLDVTDPNEAIWMVAFHASIAGGADPDAAREEADKALAVVVERWPRNRKVVTETMYEAALEQVRKDVGEQALRDERQLVRSMADALSYSLQSSRSHLHDRPDAWAVLSTFATAMSESLFDDRMQPRRFVPPLVWKVPELQRSDDEKTMVEIRARLGDSRLAAWMVRDHIERLLTEAAGCKNAERAYDALVSLIGEYRRCGESDAEAIRRMAASKDVQQWGVWCVTADKPGWVLWGDAGGLFVGTMVEAREHLTMRRASESALRTAHKYEMLPIEPDAPYPQCPEMSPPVHGCVRVRCRLPTSHDQIGRGHQF